MAPFSRLPRLISSLFLFCPLLPGATWGGGTSPAGGYVVVVSKATFQTRGWLKVVDCLVKKHGAKVLTYEKSPSNARQALSRLAPAYVCFVATPKEVDRPFVVAVNRTLRALDPDPFWDAQWGIVTGYTPWDALALAAWARPLRVRRLAAGCGLPLELAREGVYYSECNKNQMVEKVPGRAPQTKKCPSDTTALLVRELNQHHPDAFFTSGHATNQDWQIGYSYRNGQFRCRGGVLYGIDTKGMPHPIFSANPKVYGPLGNCLMGLMGDRETMAVAWLRSGGAKQICGYVVPTWFGALWRTKDYFLGGRGRWTYAQSFHLAQQAIVAELQARFAKFTAFRLGDYSRYEEHFELLAPYIQKHKIPERRIRGLLWDLDTLVLYGDPAWEARFDPAPDGPPSPWDIQVTRLADRIVLEVKTHAKGTWDRFPALLLPRKPGGWKVLEGAQWKPQVADDYLALPFWGEFRGGETFRVVLGEASKKESGEGSKGEE